jgi:hypothetical protein
VALRAGQGTTCRTGRGRNYGRVRIHHRSVSEYLTARWLWSLMQRGLDPSEVERLLFQQTPSGPALPPELVQAAAWLATESPFIRDRVMAVAPLALLEGGDPQLSAGGDEARGLAQALAGGGGSLGGMAARSEMSRALQGRPRAWPTGRAGAGRTARVQCANREANAIARRTVTAVTRCDKLRA